MPPVNASTNVVTGRQRLLTVLTGPAAWLAFAHFILEMSNNYLPILYPVLQQSMGLTYEQIGTITLAGGIFGAMVRPLFGLLADRWDARSQLILSIGWIGIVMGSVGFFEHYWLLLPVVALGALGSAAFHPPGAVLAGTFGRRRRGTAMSLFSIGGNLGAAASPLLVGVGLAAVGVRGTAVLWPVALVATWLLATRLPQMRGEQTAAATAATASRATPGAWGAVALLILFVASRSWFQGTLMTYLPAWLNSQGRSLESAGLILSLMLIALGGGSLIGGTLSDRVGRIPIVIVSLGALTPLFLLFLAASGAIQVMLVMAIGAAIGATFPVSIVLAQETQPAAPGLASSLVLGFGWLPAGLGAWAVGRLADATSLGAALTTLVWVPMVGIGAIVAYALWQRRSVAGR